MNGQTLRQRRLAAGIAGTLLSKRARIDRARLSHIERGYVEPSSSEVERIQRAIEDLTQARALVAARAAEVGWPM
jgi:predicted transcriptional regulator